jgi:hypothetical protein
VQSSMSDLSITSSISVFLARRSHFFI